MWYIILLNSLMDDTDTAYGNKFDDDSSWMEYWNLS